jgi:outer membrane protein assembly factor BamD (BamD/ComL family)
LDPQDTLTAGRFDLVAREIKADDLFKQGISSYETGRLMAAEESFKKALELRPSDAVASSYLQKIRSATAEKTSLEDIKKDPQAWRLYNQGRAAYTAGDYQKAVGFWQGLALRYPNNEALLRNIAEARKRLK